MNIRKRILVILVILSLVTVPVYGAADHNTKSMIKETGKGLSRLLETEGSLLSQGDEFPAGTSACDWTAISLALSGSKEDYGSYLEALKDYVEDSYFSNGGLDSVKATTYHRIALTVMALGGNPEAFGSAPDGSDINLIADGTYEFQGGSLGLQGLNGWIYALLTLDASQAEVPEDSAFTRDDMIAAIVNAQEPDGGFGLAPGGSDIDITAMALQALAPYKEEHSHIIESALDYLSGQMSEECLYSSFQAENVESSAQVLLALCALGIDPYEDSRFVRGDKNLITGIEGFRQEDGTYSHLLGDEEGDFLATSQTLLALIALDRQQTDGSWVFDFTNHVLPENKNQTRLVPIIGAVGGIVLISGVIIVGMRKKK